MIDVTNLTDAQADGLACIVCRRGYLRSPGVAAVPLEADGELLRGPGGSQLFVCANTCEHDVQNGAGRPADVPAVCATCGDSGLPLMLAGRDPRTREYLFACLACADD